jgi:hypothetical protein
MSKLIRHYEQQLYPHEAVPGD